MTRSRGSRGHFSNAEHRPSRCEPGSFPCWDRQRFSSGCVVAEHKLLHQRRIAATAPRQARQPGSGPARWLSVIRSISMRPRSILAGLRKADAGESSAPAPWRRMTLGGSPACRRVPRRPTTVVRRVPEPPQAIGRTFAVTRHRRRSSSWGKHDVLARGEDYWNCGDNCVRAAEHLPQLVARNAAGALRHWWHSRSGL